MKINICASLLLMIGFSLLGNAGESVPTIILAGRIDATMNTALWHQTYDQVQRAGSSFVAAAAASHAIRTEAEERLSLVLEAFRWKDPAFFARVMNGYGLSLRERQ